MQKNRASTPRPGVQAADLPHLLERFWRVGELRGGCGLGLAIVAGIDQPHGGRVQAHAALPQDLVVRAEVPLGWGMGGCKGISYAASDRRRHEALVSAEDWFR